MNKIHKFFKHRNGNFYYVLGLSMHTETTQKLVNYISLYDTPDYKFGTTWSRPLEMWDQVVENNPRFVEVQPSEELKNKTYSYLRTSYYDEYVDKV